MSVDFSYPWVADAGDGTYRNPVLHADYSDPDVIRHGNDFWMVASSFTCTPGLPILHSRDLVNWRLVNHAIENVPDPSYANVRPGCGVWAPSIRFHEGKFWIFFPMPDEGIYVTQADDPSAQWSEPWLLQSAKGWIDPCPFWDDDGQAYLVHGYANSRAGKKERLHVRPMAADGRRLLGEGREVIHTPHHAFLEGPKVHKLNGWYYILAPGGGVPTGWQVVFRSREIFGPYEEKIVLEQGSTGINGPHQGALVELANGEWWFLHFQDKGPFGRVVHLQPVAWKAGWPCMGIDYDGNGIGEPVPAGRKPGAGFGSPLASPATSDEFDAPAPGLQWQWHANHLPEWASSIARPGWLRLASLPRPDYDLSLAPHFLGQKFPAQEFLVETLLDFDGGAVGEIAGLVVVGSSQSAALGLRRVEDAFECVYLENGRLERIGPADGAVARLGVRVAADGACTFLKGAPEGGFVALPKAFQASGGAWLGAKVGLISLRPPDAVQRAGFADFDYFRFLPPKLDTRASDRLA